MKIGAVVVAAGMSSRMGTFKPILEVGQFSMVRRILSTLSNAGACPIVLVTGNRASELEQHVAGLDVVCLRNENYENSQMFDSAKIGLTHLLGTCDKVLFAPVDIPLFSVDTVRRLLNSERAFAFPVYGGRKGHPLMINGSVLPQVLAYEGDYGLRGAIRSSRRSCDFIEVQDVGMLYDVDTPEDYQQVLKLCAQM